MLRHEFPAGEEPAAIERRNKERSRSPQVYRAESGDAEEEKDERKGESSYIPAMKARWAKKKAAKKATKTATPAKATLAIPHCNPHARVLMAV